MICAGASGCSRTVTTHNGRSAGSGVGHIAPVADTEPSACSVKLHGISSGDRVLSGDDRTKVRVPEGTTVHISGTVTDRTEIPEDPLRWELAPLTSGSTPPGGTAEVDATWTGDNGPAVREVAFRATSGGSDSIEWDLRLTSDEPGCLPAIPQACAQSGGNFFFEHPTTLDGKRYEGCYQETSCVDDILPSVDDPATCSTDDLLVRANSTVPTHIAVFLGPPVAVVNHRGPPLEAADDYGLGVVATTMDITVSDDHYLIVLATTNRQGTATVRADPGVIDDVLERNPDLAEDNPGLSGN